jgi:DNA-binding transcriptional LysR family regulator
MPISLHHLRVFEAVTRTGSFRKAAERLSVTPPAVSLQVRQLEEHCGVALFERTRQRARLTPAGATLQHYARRILALTRDAEEALEQTRRFEGGELRIVASETAAACYLPPVLTAFRRRYPGLRLRLSVENTRRVAERIRELEDDLGILGESAAHPDLVFEPFVEDPLVVIVARDHPWAKRRAVSLRDLEGKRLILREPGSASRELIRQRFLAMGIALEASMEIGSNEVIKRAVELGNGISLMSATIVQPEVESGRLRAIPVQERGLVRTIQFAYHRERRDSPLVRAVLQIAREAAVARSRSGRGRKMPLDAVGPGGDHGDERRRSWRSK